MKKKVLHIPCFTPITVASEMISKSFRKDNQITAFSYFGSYPFSDFKDSTPLFAELSQVYFSPSLRQFSLMANSVSDPENMEEVIGRKQAIRNFMINLSQSCDEITKFILNDRFFSDQMVKIVRDASWRFLVTLELPRCQISWEGARMIFECKMMALRFLRLDGNRLKNRGIKFIVMGNWPFLQKLEIMNTSLTSNSIKLLLKVSSRKMKRLDISFNLISFQDLRGMMRVGSEQIFCCSGQFQVKSDGLLFRNLLIKCQYFWVNMNRSRQMLKGLPLKGNGISLNSLMASRFGLSQ